MKKRDIILFSIILISIVEIALATADVTAPDLNFISPTAEDNANINSDYTLLNVSIAEENLDDIIFSWDGTDHTAYNDSLVFFMNLDNNALISETSVSAADNSNYENNGIIHGASWTADGKYGSALEFNGGGDYVDCGNDNSLDITDAITISAWIKRDDLNNEDEILSKRQSGQVPYRFKISDGDRLYFRCYSNSTEGEILIVDAGTATPLSNYASSGDVSTLNNAWLSFDGIDDYVEVADADELSVSNTGKFTVSFWIKPATSEFEGSSASGYREILGKGSSGEHEYLVRFFNSSVSGANTILFILQSLAGSSHGTTRSSKINTNEWNLVTATVDATQVCIYSNGDKDDCDTYSIPIGSGTAPLRMGTKRKTTKDWFNGSMDDIKIWNKTLDPKIIKREYRESTKGSDWGKGIPVLGFHIIRDTYISSTVTRISDFNETMIWLDDNGFETITYDDYLSWRNGESLLPARPIILDFDDGHRTVWENALPIMDEHNFKGVMFLITNRTNNQDHYSYSMNWSQMQDLVDSGWQIGSHSVTHPDFLRLSSAERIQEFSQSRQEIIDNLGITPTAFQYPYNSNNDMSDSECALYYDICKGYGATTIALTKDTYLFKNANLTHESGSPIGMRRNSMHDFTTLQEVIDLVDDTGVVMNQRFNENDGAVTHDISNYRYDGTIYGASWQDDNMAVALTEDVDFSIVDNTFTLLNPLYSWTKISIGHVSNSWHQAHSGVHLIQDHDWHYVVGTYDKNLTSDNFKVYIDSVHRGSGTYTLGLPSNPTQDLYIGRYSSGYFNGTIDDVKIWNRALTDEEIRVEYNTHLKKINYTDWYLQVNATSKTDGSYDYYFWAKDNAGNEGMTVSRTINVNTTAPITDTPNTIIEEKNINLYITTVDETVANITYSLDGAGNVTVCVDCSSVSESNNFIIYEGDHNVTLYLVLNTPTC